MKSHYRLDVELTLLGPILTKGGQTPEPGIDAPIARDALGRPILAYSHVKGKVLDAFHDLGRGDDPQIHGWLGKPSSSGDEPDRGRLRFSDFVTEQSGTNAVGGDPIIERIRIDHKTGSVAPGALAMLEAPFGYGEPVKFTGRVEFIADAAEAATIRAELELAFKEVPAFGSLRTVGFGRMHHVAAELKPAAPTATGTPPSAAALPVRLRLDRPLCVVGPKHGGNHFNSLTHVPGAVLKGAVARLVQELTGHTGRALDDTVPGFRALCKHFEKVRFAEARPMELGAAKRPVEPPLSLVKSASKDPAHNGHFCDVALWEKPDLIHGLAPIFDIDWKGDARDKVCEWFRWPRMHSERRTRTAINRDTGRAKDQQLFSYGVVPPEFTRRGSRVEIVWETAIGLETVPPADHAAVIADLRELLAHGLPNVGKTRAVGNVEWLTARTPPAAGEKAPPDGSHVVTLQTECLMTDPAVVTKDGLEAAYRQFWADVSGGAFKLEWYFARQTLHGGHLARRTRQARYEPFLTTDRGSAFVLKPTGAGDADAKLHEWRAGGLPVPTWVEKRYGVPLWQTCPFLPHVGFGEVAVDLECHVDWREGKTL